MRPETIYRCRVERATIARLRTVHDPFHCVEVATGRHVSTAFCRSVIVAKGANCVQSMPSSDPGGFTLSFVRNP